MARKMVEREYSFSVDSTEKNAGMIRPASASFFQDFYSLNPYQKPTVY